MPALQGHPRKDGSFEIGEKYPRPLRNAVASVQGWPEAEGRRLRLQLLKVGAWTNIVETDISQKVPITSS